jgi:FkbM family methyltransferase
VTKRELSFKLLSTLRTLAHAMGASGKSPSWYRHFVRRYFEQMLHDKTSNTVKVYAGPLIGTSKYGPFCERDVEFAAGCYEPETVKALVGMLAIGQTALDVGANGGYHTLLMSKIVGNTGRVYAFEPVPTTRKWLRETVERNSCDNVVISEFAVGPRPGREEIRYDGELDGFATLAGTGHGYYDNRRHQALEVDVVSLDTWMQSARLNRVDLVKIDVEGAELGVLEGMTEIFESSRPVVICEFWGLANIARGTSILERHGYLVSTLDNWEGKVDSRSVEIRNVLAVPVDRASVGVNSHTGLSRV